MAEDQVVHVVMVPEDGLCEGCGEAIGEEVFETDDMVTVCRACWDLCVADCAEEIETPALPEAEGSKG